MVCVRGQFTGWKFSLSNNSAQKTVNWMATYSTLQIFLQQELPKFPVDHLKPCKLYLYLVCNSDRDFPILYEDIMHFTDFPHIYCRVFLLN